MANDPEVDPQLLSKLEQAKKQLMYFAALYKGKQGTLVVAKSKLSASVLDKAKKKLAGSVALGTVTADAGVFRFASSGGKSLADSLKAIIETQTGKKLNCVVVAPGEEAEDGKKDEKKEEAKKEEAKKSDAKNNDAKDSKDGKKGEAKKDDKGAKQEEAKPTLDAELKAALSTAKRKKQHFALIGTSLDKGKLIVGPRTPPPKAISEAKAESGGTTVFRGVVQGEKGTMIFSFPKKPPAKFAGLIKGLAYRDAKTSLSVRLGIMTDKNDLGDIGPTDEMPADELNMEAWEAAAGPLRDEYREAKAGGAKLDVAAKLYKQSKELATAGKFEDAFARLGEFEEELDKAAEAFDAEPETPDVEDEAQTEEAEETVAGEDEGFGTDDDVEGDEEADDDEGEQEEEEEEEEEVVEDDGKKRKKSTHEKILDLIALIASLFARSSNDKKDDEKKKKGAPKKKTPAGKKKEEDEGGEDDAEEDDGPSGQQGSDAKDEDDGPSDEPDAPGEEVEEPPQYPTELTKDQAEQMIERLKEVYATFKRSKMAKSKERLKLVRTRLLEAKAAIKTRRGRAVGVAMENLQAAMNQVDESFQDDTAEWSQQAERVTKLEAGLASLQAQRHKHYEKFSYKIADMKRDGERGKFKRAHKRLKDIEKDMAKDGVL